MQQPGRFFQLVRNRFSRRSGIRFAVVGSWSTLMALLIVSILTTAAGARRSPGLAAELTEGAQATAALSDTASRLLADPYYAGFFEAANVNPNSREDEYAASFSVERASAFLDRVAVGWGEAYRCVTCHTNGYYLTAPTVLFGDRPAFRAARQQAEAFVESWDAALPEVPEHDGDEVEDIYTYTVATAAFLTINDAQAGRELSHATLTALRRSWAIQDEDGHWPGWVKGNWPPFESDDHFGVTLMAIAVGMAPDTYRQREEVRVGMQRIRHYLTSAPPPQAHHKAMQLWAGRYHDDLVSDAERDSWIHELLELQRPDGGWASGDLGDWRQRDGDPTQPPVNVESDGYGTGFVIFALRQAGVSAANERLQRGIQWLMTNQRAAGHWWTQSLRNNPTTPNFLTHAGTTFALKALVSMDAL